MFTFFFISTVTLAIGFTCWFIHVITMFRFQRRRPGAEFRGDENFFRGPELHFSRKFLTTFFSVIDQVFRMLCFFIKCGTRPFLHQKTTILEKNSLIRPFSYSVRTFARIRQHYFYKYWGDQCMLKL